MRPSTLGGILLLTLSMGASALDIERSTTVNDDSGGSLAILTTGEQFADSGSSLTELSANAFSPRGAGSISGSLTRERVRGVESLDTVYDGEVTITGTDADGKPTSAEVELADLRVLRDGDGPEFSGTVRINERSFDAAALPGPAAALVRRIVRLFAFD
ncbi:MAG: hypothetical protein JNJ74_07875 [Xanthomonadales bacterium]|nr:hypothetical protein [Xanthomonadales bacterium]